MFIQRFYDYDIHSYPRGHYFNFFGLFRILKFKTNTVVEADNWIIIVEIFGKEFCTEIGAHDGPHNNRH
jgi:hypothetical protein